MQIYSIFNKWSQTSLVLRILVGLVIGACLGLIVPQWAGISILGMVFVSALKAIAPILVAVLVAASIAKAGGGLGPRFRVVISRYMLSTFIAAMCAVVGPRYAAAERCCRRGSPWCAHRCLYQPCY